MPTRVWLLRHAETAVPTVFHGAESDIGLSERGRRRTDALAPVLAALGPDAVVASAMKRAILTATPVAALCGQVLRIEPALHERRVGVLSGTPTVPEGPLWRETVTHWEAGDLEFTTNDAESFADIQRRVIPVWERLTTEYADRKLIVVAHGVVIRVLLLSILPEWSPTDWRKFPSVSNLAVSELVGNDTSWRSERLCEIPECIRSVE
jgi:probable phosphoglycerate mutase